MSCIDPYRAFPSKSIEISQLCDGAIEAQIQFLKEKCEKQKRMTADGFDPHDVGCGIGYDIRRELAIEHDIAFFQKELERRNEEKRLVFKNKTHFSARPHRSRI